MFGNKKNEMNNNNYEVYERQTAVYKLSGEHTKICYCLCGGK